MDGREDQTPGASCNSAEVSVLMDIVSCMASSEVSLKDICLVSPYRAQVIPQCVL